MHYAFLPLFNLNLDFLQAVKVTKSGHHLSHDQASKGYGSIPGLTSQTSLHACLQRLKGKVSQTAHVQVINQKWSDVFKFVICETKWRQQAVDNPPSHGGRRNNSGRKQFFLIPAAAGKRNGRSREEEFGSK